MIIFRSVKWKNLLSTGNYWTEIKLDNNDNTLIVGSNGSGKSTLLDALCFALFGKAFRSINKPQLLNSINNKDLVTEVCFDTGNKSYKIIRGIKPNIFQIYCDGELLNQDAAARDYQEHLEKFILKMSYKSFTQIVILGSASFVPFMQLSAADRRAIIEDLLDIQIFSVMNNILKEKLSNNKDLTQQTKHDIELKTQKYDLLQKHIDELRQGNEQRIQEFENEINTNLNVIESLMANVTLLTAETEELQQQVTAKLDTENKVKKILKLESQIENNMSKIKKDISFFESHDDCPTCKQSIEEVFKTTELGYLSKKLDECQDGLSQLGQKLQEEQTKLDEINNVQKQIQRKQVEIATNSTSLTETNKYIEKLRKQVESLKNSTTVTEKEENELRQIQFDLESVKQKLRGLLFDKNYFEVASNLLKDTGIKTKIVKQYLPIINKLVNKYLASLDFFVNFNLDESFKETIKSRFRDEFTYNNFSEGEKQRIDMALMLTWRAVAKLKNSSNTNLLILDETFDSSLDANGTEYLMNILHMLEDVNLFVISHKGDILQDKFNNVIRFVKEKNFSKVSK